MGILTQTHNGLNFLGTEAYIQADGSTKMTIKSNGKVGIGTTSPESTLHVYTASGQANIKVQSGGNDAVFFANASTNFGIWGFDNARLSLATNSTERVSITGGGNVGIGTTSPAGKLDISGTGATQLYVSTTSTSSEPQIIFIDGSNDYFALQKIDRGITFKPQGAEAMRIDGDGNVGIGTTSPSAKLHVEGDGSIIRLQNNNSDTNGTFIDFRDSAGVRTGYVGTTGTSDDMFLFTQGSKPIRFYTNASEKMRIASDGNVGIGTTDPTSRLHVEDTTAFITVRGTDASYSNAGIQLISGNASNNRALGVFHYVENSDVEWFAGLPYSGNDAYVINRNTGYTVPSSQSSPPGIGASGGRLLTINSSGNVGIGTTSPDEKLHVSGNAKVTNLGINAGAQDYLSSLSARLVVGGNVVVNHNNPLIYLRSNSSGNDSDIRYQTALKFTNGAGSTHAYINSSGNVGIGTTSPNNKLDVSGAVNASEYRIGNGVKLEASSSYTMLRDPNGVRKIYLGGVNDEATYIDGNTIYFRPKGGGSTRMVINSSGNVGIGTTSVSAKLVVKGADSAADYADYGIAAFENQQNEGLSIGYDTGDNYSYLYSREVGVSSRGLRLNGSIYVAGINGNVGIGTSSPDAGLHVESTGVSASGYKYHMIVDDNNAYGINNGGGIIFRGDYNSSTAKANFAAIRAGKANANDGNANAYLAFLYGASGTLTEGMRIKENGNVGIGTTSPTELLELDRDGKIGFGANGDYGIRTGYFDDTGGVHGFHIDTKSGGTWSTRRFVVRANSGNVGIGTDDPAYKLDVAGTSRSDLYIFRSNQSAPTADAFIFRPADNTVALGTANAERMRITSTGKVGIGTDNPGEKLHIAGNIRATGWIGESSSNRIEFDESNNLNFYVNGVWVAQMQPDGDLHVKGDIIAFSDIFNP